MDVHDRAMSDDAAVAFRTSTRPVSIRRTHAASVVFIAAVGVCGLLEAGVRGHSLRDVLRRAGEYVIGYGGSLETVIADEEYTQQLVTPADGGVLRERVLRSEIAFVRLAGSQEWQAFRNVINVDGAPVAGAEGRLERVFRSAPQSIVGQARLIAQESARYNLGPLHRNFNAPTMPLQFLHPSHQERFRFDKRREETVSAERVWVLRFRERPRGTLIRNMNGRDVPVEGLLWVVPEDGRVLRASFFATNFLPSDAGTARSRADLEVTWRPDQKLGLWVPAEMRERYTGPWVEDASPCDVTGLAVYSNYRRFDVDARIIDRK